MTSSITLIAHNCKIRAQTTQVFYRKMISIKLSFKWGVYQLFLLTLIFERVGRLGQIRSIRTPYKILTLELKNRPVEPFNVPIIKAE